MMTEDAGRSSTFLDVLTLAFVLPVKYVNDWFQESTWTSIRTSGNVRTAGRPDYRECVILREEATKLAKEHHYGSRTCAIYERSYDALEARGGFGVKSQANRAWVYGRRFASEKQGSARVRELEVALNRAAKKDQKPVALKAAVPKTKRKMKPVQQTGISKRRTTGKKSRRG
jgi:hypothetical protein